MWLWLLLLHSATAAAPGPAPTYQDDPFGDADFAQAPLVLDAAHTSRGKGEVSLLLATSVINKYNGHLGGVVEASYHFSDTLGARLSLGYMHGSLTPIVTGADGIIDNAVEKCRDEGDCSQVNPDIPDLTQITGLATASFVWSPLYGKISLVSELDVNLQLYTALGAGVNGTRQVAVRTYKLSEEPNSPLGFNTAGGNFGDAGFFSDPMLHANIAIGVKAFVADWISLRLEVSDLLFFDKYDFNRDGAKERYRSDHFFANLGAGFVLF